MLPTKDNALIPKRVYIVLKEPELKLTIMNRSRRNQD